MPEPDVGPAFYARPGGPFAAAITLLHPPYTAWHLAYVAIGAGIAPSVDGRRLIATLLAFFLAVGVAAHCLDEVRGRPLGTPFTARTLIATAAVALGGAVAIGIVGVAEIGTPLAAFVVVGAATVVAYNLELGGRFVHNDIVFALTWGAFPVLTSYLAQTGRVDLAALLAAAFAATTSGAQRTLSTWARTLRRRSLSVSAEVRWRDAATSRLSRVELLAPVERALALLAIAHVVLAAALLLR